MASTSLALACFTCLTVAVTLVIPRSANAGTCAEPGVRVSVAGSSVPTNPSIRMTFQDKAVQIHDLEDGTARIRDTIEVTAETAVFGLKGTEQDTIPVSAKWLPNTTLPTLVLTPRSELKAHHRYSVVLLKKARSYAFHYFQTGSGADREPPKLEGVKKTRYRRQRETTHWKDASGPDAQLWLKGLADSGQSQLSLEIHDLPKGAEADESTLRSTPMIIGDSVRFGNLSSCTPANFLFPIATTTKGHHKTGPAAKMRIGVRVVDLAGNHSSLHVVELKLR